MANEASVVVALPNPGRTSLLRRFGERHIFESTCGQNQAIISEYDSYKAIFYQDVEKDPVELRVDQSLGKSRPLLQSIAILSPKNLSVLD